MNNTVTLSQLITRLAKTTGVDTNTARRFLRSFFATIEESLEAGQSVTVKNIGTFRRTEADEDGRSSVAFIPEASVLEELNRPFEMFEAVELADGVDFSEVDAKEDTAATEPVEEKTVVEEVPVAEIPVVVEEETVVIPEEPAAPQPKPEPAQNSAVENKNTEPVVAPRSPVRPAATEIRKPQVAAVAEEEPDEPFRDSYERSSRRIAPVWIWAGVIVLAACIVGWLAATWSTPIPDLYDFEEEEELVPDTMPNADIIEVGVEEVPTHNVTAETSAPATVAPAPVASAPATPAPKPETAATPAAEPVYDTVEVSLIRLAKKHYGVPEFWVYIFDANRDKISNPNTIRPGTRVVIPDRSTFPGATLSEAKSIAKKKQSEYQSKF